MLGPSALVRLRPEGGPSLHNEKTADARLNHIMHVLHRSLHLWNRIRLPRQANEDVTLLVSSVQ